jgi:Peptidase inhibitor family I36
MRLRSALPAALLLFVASLPAFAQWGWGRPHPPREGACFYRGTGFRGDYFCLRVGERWPSLPHGFNDRIRSIQVFNGAHIRVFNDDGFGGISARLDGDVDDLRELRLPGDPHKSWSDRISSIAVFRGRDEWEHPRRRDERGDEPGY